MDESALARVEKQRIELEANIAKFRKSLRYWQTLEIDYEGLKEEFLGIPEDSSIDDCLQAGLDFKAELVDDNEIRSFLRDGSARPRRPSQLVEVLTKRVEYVSKNVESVRKQLSIAEKKRNALLLAEEPEHRDDAGLPLAEIMEELDESGNVISSKVQAPGAEVPQLIDVLKKAGVNDLEETNGTIKQAEILETAATVNSPDPSIRVDSDETSDKPLTDSGRIDSGDNPDEARLRQEMLDYRSGLDEVGAIVAELDLEEGMSDISYDEEDYNLDIDSDFEDDDDVDESEDETGKSKDRLHLSKSYRRQMEELQSKLGLQNVGPQSESGPEQTSSADANRLPAAKAAGEAALARQTQAAKGNLKPSALSTKENEKSKGKPKKKKVVFSSELDIATEESSSQNARMGQERNKSVPTKPLIESVIERTEQEVDRQDAHPIAPTLQSSRNSRFKSDRQTQSRGARLVPSTDPSAMNDRKSVSDVHESGQSAVISRDLVERPAAKTAKPPDLADFADEDHQREITLDYQRMRMKRIHSQEGGFLGQGEDDNWGEVTTPILEEDESGKQKKISRFKAARLKQ